MPEHATVQRLVRLIHRYLREDITEKEQEELSAWIKGSGKGDLFDLLTSEFWLEKELPSYNEYEKQSGEDWKKIEETLFRKNLIVRIRAIPKWMRYAAVACIMFGLIVLAIRLFVTHPSQVTAPVLADNRQIQPNKPSATLLLQDGTIIPLENACSGIVTRQGEIKVIKKKDQLLYVKKTSTDDSLMPEYKPYLDFTISPYLDTPATMKIPGQMILRPEYRVLFITYNTLKVAVGGQYTISLPDGSKIWLNAQSILRFPTQFIGPERRVYLSGEAYFEVSSNPSQPFIVVVHRDNDSVSTEFQAIGTKFNIRAYNDEPGIITTVVEGTVKAFSREQSYLIPLHGQLQWREGKYTVVDGVKDTVATGWKDGYFELDDSNIGEMMNMIKRWYGIEVILNADSQRRVSGRISKSTRLNDVIEILKKLGYQVKLAENVLTISDK